MMLIVSPESTLFLIKIALSGKEPGFYLKVKSLQVQTKAFLFMKNKNSGLLFTFHLWQIVESIKIKQREKYLWCKFECNYLLFVWLGLYACFTFLILTVVFDV